MVEQLLQQLAAQLPPELADVLLNMLPPEAQQVVLQAAGESGIDTAIAILQQMIQDFGIPVGGGAGAPPPEGTPPGPLPPGMGGVESAGPPLDPTQLPPPEALASMPGGGPPPGSGLPPEVQAMLSGAPLPPGAAPQGPQGTPPPQMEQPKPPEVPKEAEEKKPPKWLPPGMRPSRFAKEKPKLSRVLEDARTFRQEYSGRDTRIKEDTDMAHLDYDLALDQTEGQFIKGEWVHRRADPAVYLSKVVSVAAATGNRYHVQVNKRHPAKEYVEAAQDYEDFLRYSREQEEQRWFERGSTMGDPQMPLPRLEAGVMALEGAVGWKWHVDPEDEELPFQCEFIPASQLYPGGHATVRQYQLPLHKARAEFAAIEKAYPVDNTDEPRSTNGNGKYDDKFTVRIIEWADVAGYWHAIAWEDASPWSKGTSGDGKKNGWVQSPQRMGYGIPMFSYVQWGGTFANPSTTKAGGYFSRYRGQGILTPLNRTFRLYDIMTSAVATGAIRSVNPSTLRKVQEGRDMMEVPELDWSPGAENFVREGEDVKPLGFEIANSASGVAFIQALGQELQSAIPPVFLNGAAASGMDRLAQQEDGNTSVVNPIIDALQNMYEMMNRQRGILAYRFAKRDKDGKEWKDREYFDKYTFTGSKRRGYLYSGELTPKTLELSSNANQVKYDFKTLTEKIQIAGYVTQLVNAHLMEQEEALTLLGRDDPTAVMNAIIRDAAMMEPDLLKARVETEILKGDDPVLKDAWIRVFYMKPNQGSQPAQPGQASQPGGDVQGTPPPPSGGPPPGMM